LYFIIQTSNMNNIPEMYPELLVDPVFGFSDAIPEEHPSSLTCWDGDDSVSGGGASAAVDEREQRSSGVADAPVRHPIQAPSLPIKQPPHSSSNSNESEKVRRVALKAHGGLGQSRADLGQTAWELKSHNNTKSP
jgi:hypothetical protein